MLDTPYSHRYFNYKIELFFLKTNRVLGTIDGRHDYGVYKFCLGI